MSETASDTLPERQIKLLQYFLLGSTIPFKEGGGVVFPHGFPGVGYRLEDWQFERYRARLDRTMLGEAARKRWRILFFSLIVLAIAVFAISLGAPFISNHPAVAPLLDRWGISFDPWPLFMILIISAVVFRRIQRTLVMRQPEQSQPFEGAPQVSRFAYLPRRVLGMIASGQISQTAQHLKLLLGGGLSLVLFLLGLSGSEFRGENFFLAAILLIYALRPSCFCWVYWQFRLRHGRAPTPIDLKPVSLPQA